MKIYSNEGVYFPSFFLVKINKEKNIDRILFHELVHFLQDISTTFGLINISNTVDRIKDLNKIAIDKKLIDSNTHKNYSKFHQDNIDLFSYYQGDSVNKYKTFNNSIKIIKIVEEESMIDYDVKEIHLFFGNNCIDSKEYFNFGALAILESMANILENWLFDKEIDFRTYPYDAVSMIVEYIYPLKNVLAVSELCEASLMYYHPGEILINSLKLMKEKQFKHLVMGDTYNFILNNFTVDDKHILNHFSSLVEITSKQLDDLIAFQPYHKEKLGRYYVQNANKIFRINKNAFITSLFYDKNINTFIKVFETIGLPLIINNNETFSSITTEKLTSPVFFPAIATVFKILSYQSDKSCELIEHCCQSQNEFFKESICKNNPLNLLKHQNSNLCPFLYIWKVWKLENVKID